MRAVARGENTAGSGKAEQEVLQRLYEMFCFSQTVWAKEFSIALALSEGLLYNALPKVCSI